MKKLITAIAFTSVAWSAQGGILGDMNSMFMSNATGATTMTTKDRTGVFGGSFSMRAPIKNINVVAFDPPRMDAGCGGLDLFGGSFSYINSQELVEMFRRVAANAAGLAFKAAIKAISPSLSDLMDYFQTMMKNMNLNAKNSCQMAHLIVTKDISAKITQAIQGEGNTGAVQKSMVSDHFGALKEFIASKTGFLNKAAEANANVGNSEMKAILASGATNILGMAGLANFDGSNDNDSSPNSLNNRLLISILGFEIAGKSCTTRNEAGTADSGTERIGCKGPATITLFDLIAGGGTGSINASTPLKLYRCMNPDGTPITNGGFDVQKCTDMKKEDFNYEGIQGWVNTMLYGGPTSRSISTDSIVGKINQGGSFEFTPAQKAFIRQSGLPLANLLTKTSSPTARITMSEKLGAYLGNCVGARFGEALYKSANSVTYGHNIAISDDAKRKVEQLRLDFQGRANDCIKSNTTLEIANTLNAAAALNANSK